MTKLYEGYRSSPTLIGTVTVQKDDTKPRLLPRRADLLDAGSPNHDWGRSKNEGGVYQLAIDLLADALGDDARAKRLHADFAKEFVRMLDTLDPWSTSDSVIRDFAERLEAASLC